MLKNQLVRVLSCLILAAIVAFGISPMASTAKADTSNMDLVVNQNPIAVFGSTYATLQWHTLGNPATRTDFTISLPAGVYSDDLDCTEPTVSCTHTAFMTNSGTGGVGYTFRLQSQIVGNYYVIVDWHESGGSSPKNGVITVPFAVNPAPYLDSTTDHKFLNFTALPQGNFSLIFGISGKAPITKNYDVIRPDGFLTVDVTNDLGIDNARLMVSIMTPVYIDSHSTLWKNVPGGNWLELHPTLHLSAFDGGFIVHSHGLYDFELWLGLTMKPLQKINISEGDTKIMTPSNVESWLPLPAINISIEESTLWPYWVFDPASSWYIRNPNLDEIFVNVSGSPSALRIDVSNHTQVLIGILTKGGDAKILKTNSGVYDSTDWSSFTISIENVVDQVIKVQSGNPLGWNYDASSERWNQDFNLVIKTIFLPAVMR